MAWVMKHHVAWISHSDVALDESKSSYQRWASKLVLVLVRGIYIGVNHRLLQWHLPEYTASAFAVRRRVLYHRQWCSCGLWPSCFFEDTDTAQTGLKHIEARHMCMFVAGLVKAGQYARRR